MKYKILAITASVFLGLFAAMYIGNIGISLFDNFKESGVNFSTIKSTILDVKDNDSQHVPFRKQYINMNGALHVMANKQYVYDAYSPVAKLKNGYLTFATTSDNKTDLDPLVEKTVQFNEYLKEKNIPLLYAQAPEKVCKYTDDNYLPKGLFSGNVDYREFINKLDNAGVDYLDCESELHKAGLDHYNMFFKTDHHWKLCAGLWAATVIGDKLVTNYGLDIDTGIWNTDLYTIDRYKDCFIGTQGSRVGLAFSPVDDFEFIYPNFETDLTVISDGEEKRGNFYDTMFSMEFFTPEAQLSDKDYVAYSGGDFSLQKIINHKNPSGPKIVMIKDSFARVVSPYLSLVCSELHILDVRYYNDMSALEYATDIDADAVIILYNPGMITEEGAFDFSPE